ncbi:MAG: glycosyltransferase family 1 protein [Chitinophagaceae bacterium]
MPDNGKKPDIVYFQRKPRNVGNYSVEFIFEDVRYRLKDLIIAKIRFSRYESTGLFKRLYNCIEAAAGQGSVNHVTGDINYLGLLMNKHKTIHTILDCVFMTSTSGLKQAILKLFWLSLPVKRSAYITAISEATKKEIITHSGCDPEKIKVIYVAISNRFSRKDKPFNKSNPVILQVGTAFNKNIPRLIHALNGLSCELHIVGKSNEEYERLLKENNITYRYQSGLTDAEIIAKYEEADIVSLVSTYEGFGMPILEAQAVGRPVITSSVFSMPEVAGDAACIVDPFDVEQIRQGVNRILHDDDFRNSLVKKGFENIKRFDPEVIAMQYYELYKKIRKS